ncbi:hypothetical protein [Streptococcus marmotae]|uniref:hypothetical protein n=1 Tax=Streptococcus marmotae TaxID=1825069 RepID=UPI00083127B7|nr:hypothetical protein [Streptococcus marmotae]
MKKFNYYCIVKQDKNNPGRLQYILAIENLVNDLLKLTLYINQQEVEVLLIHPFQKRYHTLQNYSKEQCIKLIDD